MSPRKLMETVNLERNRLRRQRGIAAVEMVIVAPLLLLMMFATADVGRLLYQYDTLTKSVRDGVRYLAANAASGSLGIVDIKPRVNLETRCLVIYGSPSLNSDGSRCSDTTNPLLPDPKTNWVVDVTSDGTQTVTVSATYTYGVGAWLPMFGYGPDLSLSVPLHATAVMRAL